MVEQKAELNVVYEKELVKKSKERMRTVEIEKKRNGFEGNINLFCKWETQ